MLLRPGNMRGGALDQIHDILNEGLTPILRVAFEDAWGKNWIDVLNSTVQRPPEQNSKKDEREDYRIIKRGDSGLAVWDDNQICHTIKRNIWKRRIDKQEKEALRGYYDGKAERLAELCQKIVDSRNLKGHRNVETAKKALSSRNVIRCGEAAVELLLAFRCRSQADEISQLLDGHDDLAPRSYQSGAVAAGTQVAVTEGDDTPAVAQPLNVGQESLDPRDFGGGRYTSSRRRSLPPPGAGVAVFPTVGEGAQGDTEQNSLASI
ncbi:hypothetical protein MPL1032_10215 [Mesorhizobium plurifarium]|uniref:Uncharacterized protein n=1 Tax=Mesorhizobium plurifarium TaxID=69974 RepID=A0A0K2VMN1_MESPL|nr:hypothetical protein MPL1032_10215 [Mesorhizobium plurifarium]